MSETESEMSWQEFNEKIPYHHEPVDDSWSNWTYVCDVGMCEFEGESLPEYMNHFDENHTD